MVFGTPSSTARAHLTPSGRLMNAGAELGGAAGSRDSQRRVSRTSRAVAGGSDGWRDVPITRCENNAARKMPAQRSNALGAMEQPLLVGSELAQAPKPGQQIFDFEASIGNVGEPSPAILLEAPPQQRPELRRRVAGKAVQSGSPRMTAPSVSATATPGNARFAVNISYNRQPNAQMSLLPSTRSPMACSGLT